MKRGAICLGAFIVLAIVRNVKKLSVRRGSGLNVETTKCWNFMQEIS